MALKENLWVGEEQFLLKSGIRFDSSETIRERQYMSGLFLQSNLIPVKVSFTDILMLVSRKSQKPTAKSRKALKKLESDPTHSTSRTIV